MSGRKKPTISLCLVARDEELRLPRCLASVKGQVDEMVVVDTGSRDRTREIASAAGARVVDAPWNDDFAAARNRSLAEARGEWALFLDADEVLTPAAGEDLRRISRNPRVMGIFFPLRDLGDKGRETVTLMFRAVRNRPDVRWRYRIHEQILPDVNRVVQQERLRLATAEGEIVHDGYQHEVMVERGKNDRNRRLFEAQLQETPDDLYILYKYADFLRRFPGDEGQAMDVLERALHQLRKLGTKERRSLTFGGEICALLGLARQRRGDLGAALEVLRYGLEQCRATPNLWYVYAHGQLLGGDAAEAEQAFRRCQASHGKPSLIPAQPQVTGPGAQLGVARALARQGRLEEAARTAWEALGTNPHHPEAVGLWVDLEVRAGDLSRATARLIQRVKEYPLCGATWFKGGELFFRLRLFDKALPWLMRAAELLENPTPALALQGECFMASGHYEPAMDAFLRGRPDARCRAGVLLLSLAFGVEPEDPSDLEDALVLAEFRRMVGNLRELGERVVCPRLHQVARRGEEIHPRAQEFLETVLG